MSQRSLRYFTHSAKLLRALTTFVALAPIAAIAASDSWNAGDGDYTQSSNWLGGNVPNGAGDHADFSLLDITSDVSVTLNQDITLGRLSFGDTNLGSAGTWALGTESTNVITLDNGASQPVLFGGPITPTEFDDSFIGASLGGTNGFAKEGAGIVTIAGAMNTITGGIDINAGTLRVSSAVPGQAITIADGATLNARADVRGAGFSINAASGSTVNIIADANVGTMNAEGSTINLSTPADGGTASASDNWAGNGSIAVLNVSGDDATTSFFRLHNNGGGYSGASLAGTAVNLDNITTWTRTNSGGNTNQFGSLSGTSTAILSGGGDSGGTDATYTIGALNTDTEFAGTIDTTSAPAPNSTTDVGGLNLTKVGTGALTLSGNLLYQPTGNTNASRRGGITTIAAGTLKLTNSAAIPGGFTHGTAGDVVGTINVQTDATLDVTGYSGSYSTAELQQIVGGGTIAGNYTHDDGSILPGNTISGTNPVSNAVGGMLTVTNNFAWNGGAYVFDLTNNPAEGNDLISVGGMTTITGGTVTANFLGAAPTTATAYTLLSSSGGITGSPAGITIAWPGRGAAPVPFIDGNDLKFNAPPVGSMVWQGNDGTNPTYWDVETTPNWTGATPNTFFDNDLVTFGDTAASYTVDIRQEVGPSLVTISNVTNDYVFNTSASGSIVGGTGLVKTGSGNVTMDVNNTFTGAAQLSGGGTIDIVGRSSALGRGGLEMNGITIRSSASGATLANNSSLTVGSGVNTIQGEDVIGSGSQFTIPTLLGSGTLTITSTLGNPFSGNEQDGKWFVLNNTSGFTGTLNLTGPDASQQGLTVRARHGATQTQLGTAVLNMTNATIAIQNSQSQPTPNRPITIGELHGDSQSRLAGFIGGSSGRPNIDWTIGALNSDSDFAGDITDPGGGNNAQSFLVKVGTGTLTLMGTKSYTGDTTVMDGTLSIDTPYLSDAADVYLTSSSIFDLDFGSLGTIDTIDSLFIDGVSQDIGTWGRLGSGADFESALFTGDGLLMVSTQEALLGDFDNDGDVDGRDFLVWQRDPGVGNLSDWQTNYGAGAVAAANATTAAVPEPAAGVMLLAGLLFAATRRQK